MNKNALQKTVRRATAWCLVLSLAGAPALPVLAQATAEWSLEQYQQLSNDMAAADELVLLMAPGSEDWRSASQAALDARRALVVYISNALRSGSMPAEFLEPATQARFLLIQNIIDLTADLGLCDQAQAALVLLREVSDTSETLREAFELSQQAVVDCEPYSAVSQTTPAPVVEPATPPPVAPIAPEPAQQASVSPPPAEPAGASQGGGTPSGFVQAEPERTASPLRGVGVALLATGGAMLAGGLAWDAASAAGPRREFSDLSGTCEVGLPCYDRWTELADQIDASKAPIGALTIGGAALAVTGTVLFLAAPRDRDSARVNLTPAWRPGYVGATIGFR